MFINEDASQLEGHSRSGAGRGWLHVGVHRFHAGLRGLRKLNHLQSSFLQECTKSFNSGHSNRSVYRVKAWSGGVWVIKKYLFKEVKFLLDKSKQLKD